MKIATDKTQGKVLRTFLPKASNDMYYWCGEVLRIGSHLAMEEDLDIPAWSLSALFNVIPLDRVLLNTYEGFYYGSVYYWDKKEETHEIESEGCTDPIDAMVDLIVKLHEKDLI
jgi:hypothetical protein